MLLSALLIGALFIGPSFGSSPRAAEPPDTYGAGVSLPDVTPLRHIIERPGDFEGKTVRIEGVVTAVCAHMGCWMALAPSDTPGSGTVRLKVEDGVIVFPVSAKGRRAEAQGVVERLKSDDAEGREAAGEHARQTDSARPASSTWHVKATGAVVH